MVQDIRSDFENLKICTLECINSIKNDDYDALDKLILKRKDIMNFIQEKNYSKDECSSIVDELNILYDQKILSDLVYEKRTELKDKIDNIEKNKIAANSYNKGSFKSAIIFSKKI